MRYDVIKIVIVIIDGEINLGGVDSYIKEEGKEMILL